LVTEFYSPDVLRRMSKMRRAPDKSATASMFPLLADFKEMDTADSIVKLTTELSSFLL